MNPLRFYPAAGTALLFLLELAGLVVVLKRLRDAVFKAPRRLMIWGFIIQIPGLAFSRLLEIDQLNDGSLLSDWLVNSSIAHPGVMLAWTIGLGIMDVVGVLLFACGFLFVGLRTGRMNQRSAELETLAASMRAELAARGESL